MKRVYLANARNLIFKEDISPKLDDIYREAREILTELGILCELADGELYSILREIFLESVRRNLLYEEEA